MDKISLALGDVEGNPFSFSALWPHEVLFREEKLIAGL
jgi:hypothetical protein